MEHNRLNPTQHYTLLSASFLVVYWSISHVAIYRNSLSWLSSILKFLNAYIFWLFINSGILQIIYDYLLDNHHQEVRRNKLLEVFAELSLHDALCHYISLCPAVILFVWVFNKQILGAIVIKWWRLQGNNIMLYM